MGSAENRLKLNANIILSRGKTERALRGKEGKRAKKRDTVTKKGGKKISVRTEEA